MRILTETEDKYKHNTWDEAKIPEEYLAKGREKIEKDKLSIRKDHEITYAPWEDFYKRYNSSFFKEREWIPKEHPELIEHSNRILEIGCGTGSTLIPIIKARLDRKNDYFQIRKYSDEKDEKDEKSQETSTDSLTNLSNPDLSRINNIFGIDYSPTAIEILKKKLPQLESNFFQIDMADPEKLLKIHPAPEKFNIILLIFSLSAIHPSNYENIFSTLHALLEPKGVIIFKDYYEMDLTQLRFKESQIIETNFYERGDKTYVHYFSKVELLTLARNKFTCPKYKEETKLILNRKTKQEMYRSFVELKLEKI